MKVYKVKLIKEYIRVADTEEEAIEESKFAFDYSNDSSFCQKWDEIECRELRDRKVKDEE